MGKTVFPNIKLTHDASLTDDCCKNRGAGTTGAEYYFYWYCSLLQEDTEQSMMACDNDEFLSEVYDILEMSHNRLAHC